MLRFHVEWPERLKKRYIQRQIAHGTGSEYWPRQFPPDLLKHLLIFHDSHNCPENCVPFWTGKIEQTAIAPAECRTAAERCRDLRRRRGAIGSKVSPPS